MGRQRDVHSMLPEALRESLDDDPYATAVYIISGVLELALDDGVSGAMNEHEFETLESVAKLLMNRDPSLEIEPRAG